MSASPASCFAIAARSPTVPAAPGSPAANRVTAARMAAMAPAPRVWQRRRLGGAASAPAPASRRMAPAEAKSVGKPGAVAGRSMMAAMRTVSVPAGVTRTSGEPTGGGARRRGLKMVEQTAATGSGSPGSGQAPVRRTASYGQPSARAWVMFATSGGPCMTRPPGR